MEVKENVIETKEEEKCFGFAKKTIQKKRDWLYNEDDFMVEITLEDDRGLYQKRVNRPEYNNHQGKCAHRLCKELGISHKHLDKVYSQLNGRKIDGFFINDMLDRYGYEGAPNINRAQLASKYGKLPRHLAIAFDTLKAIANKDDPLKAFMKHQKEYEDALLKERRNAVVEGE